MSHQYVKIENDIPVSVTCKGIHYEETKDLSLVQLSMFIDRDLFKLRRTFPESMFSLSAVLVSEQQQLRVEATANTSEAKKLKNKIEQILWSYNQQVLIAKCGSLIPKRTRFTYKIDINSLEREPYPQAEASNAQQAV
ncbi:MAG: hypothetical protein AB8G05_27260 [Oligoflexales bacterium]